MENIQKYKLQSSFTQRYFHKSKDNSSSDNHFRFNNPFNLKINKKVQSSINNSVRNRTTNEINTERLKTSIPFQNQNQKSKMELKQYLNLIKQINPKINKSNNTNSSTFSSSSSMNMKLTKINSLIQQNKLFQKKRKVQPFIPYNQIQIIVQKIYKHYDTIKRFGYSEDQITLIIRQICSKRKNIQCFLLNKKQKLKRSYFIYDIKQKQQCIESIIKQSLQNQNGKFNSIFSDLNNFHYFLEQQIIERGRNRIKQIKNSVVNLKTQLKTNQYSEQLGFNQFQYIQSQEEKKQKKSMKANFSLGRRSIIKYMSPLSKNIDSELKVVEDQIGDFLQENRGFVQVLGKIRQTINR